MNHAARQRRAAPQPAPKRRHAQGEPLPLAVRARFEPRFGTDLSGVRVHADARAAASASALGANAYTVGQDLFFAADRYRPFAREGQELLAHELVHAVQQRTGQSQPGRLRISSSGDRAEREAGDAARSLAAGGSARVAAGSEPVALHRQGASHGGSPTHAVPSYLDDEYVFDRPEDEERRREQAALKADEPPWWVLNRPAFPVNRNVSPQRVAPNIPFSATNEEPVVGGGVTPVAPDGAKVEAEHEFKGSGTGPNTLTKTVGAEFVGRPDHIGEMGLNAGLVWNHRFGKHMTLRVGGSGGIAQNDEGRFGPSGQSLVGVDYESKDKATNVTLEGDPVNKQGTVSIRHIFGDRIWRKRKKQQDEIQKYKDQWGE